MRSIRLFTLIVLISLCSSIVYAQSTYTIPILVTNGSQSRVINLGVTDCATVNIDPCTGENGSIPVPASGTFDARFTNVLFSQNMQFGSLNDFRNTSSAFANDTFKVTIQPGDTNGNNVTLDWQNVIHAGGGYWHLKSRLIFPDFDIDMTTQSSYTYDVSVYPSVYIVKGDTTSFRTFTLEEFALDGTLDSKGKLYYGKSYKPKPDKTEFSVSFTNEESQPVNDLHVEFSVTVDPASVSITRFPYQFITRGTRADFSGATIAIGEIVTIHGLTTKPNNQKIRTWYWTKDGIRFGNRKNSRDITNELRLPMPNTVNAGEEIFTQLFAGDNMYVGVNNEALKGPPYIRMTKYSDVLKTLIAYPGKAGQQVLPDNYASCISTFDYIKGSGDRSGKVILGAQKGLAPDKHRNALLGQTLTLALNLNFSLAQKTPAGLGSLQIYDPTSLFNGKTLDTLLSQSNQYLSYCTIGDNPTLDANDLLFELQRVNQAFSGTRDTLSWGGTKTRFTGAKSLRTVPFLRRTSTIIAETFASSSVSNSSMPETYALNQNYPNPFNPTTMLSFVIGNSSLVSLRVYDMLGREVATLINNEQMETGTHEAPFDGTSLASGVYFYRLYVIDAVTGEASFNDVKRMVLVK